jgi:Cysteine rich repeat
LHRATQDRIFAMRLRPLPIVISIAICSVVPAASQEATRGALRQVCLEDFKRLCSAVTRGGGRILKCMTDNSEKLSSPCRASLGARTKSD